MGHEHVREALKTIYKSKKWSDRVDVMTEAQAVAVYIRLFYQGKIKEKRA